MVELVCTVTEKSTEGILRERVGKTFLTPPHISPSWENGVPQVCYHHRSRRYESIKMSRPWLQQKVVGR